MGQSVVITDGAARSVVIVARADGKSLDGVIEAARARWPDLAGLEAAVLHRSFADDAVVEYLRGGSGLDAQAMAAVYENFGAAIDVISADEAQLTPGPAAGDDGFVLHVDAAAPRPALLSTMKCDPANQRPLLDYLFQSAERFRGLFGGWAGAALFAGQDGSAVAEYLQFESPEAMMALAELEVIAEHKNNLSRLCVLDGIAVMPVHSWSAGG